ncbi:FAD-linked oxidoreductase afoF like protein [Verticillium longisporum]|uniref:FAD-linked oxidoreductase afoF like protein n=1 Tax=Verticillium longisporum TaxID=100787 RepID=A0A8I3A429_VERLO|nr:FAD-linked oxidoreductase afoF like protein [Verticillium longisporum]PNH43339.1 hypothetical protein VD0004_g4101 [Verticillium dahliae]PNH76200.1 hypothetical protein VD0001_g1412 [Verticillium dahliae]RBQ72592.1 hypothetical protein VDGD_03887 [Verticillium dahliae]
MSAKVEALSLTCPVSFPSPSTPLTEALHRWSETSLEHPALIITPETEADIAAAIAIARENGLKLLPAGGGHSTFVRVTPKTLYLDLKAFNSVALIRQAGTVRFGGGATTADVTKTLAAKGYYIPAPDSNAVGMVGALLGGGTSSLNGLHGFMAENAVSFRLVTADGRAREVCGTSTDPDERALFHTLCGAGHGLGVITAATMRAYPVAHLRLADGKVWARTLMFPPAALDTAAATFLSLLPPPAPLSARLVFVRAPPGSPAAGQPLIMVSVRYFGPVDDAERAAAVLLCAEVLEKTVHAETSMTRIADLPDRLDALNAHGGLKDNQAAQLERHSSEAIAESFAKWRDVTDRHDDAKLTTVVFSGFRPREPAQDEEVFKNPERGNAVLVATWCRNQETRRDLLGFMEGIMEVSRRLDGTRPRTPPNNMTDATRLEEMFSPEQIDLMRKTKERWDPEGVFWTPYKGL